MKKLLLLCLFGFLSVSIVSAQESKTFVVQDGACPWVDREGVYILDQVPTSLAGQSPVPQQICDARRLQVPDDARSIIFAVADKDADLLRSTYPEVRDTGESFLIRKRNGGDVYKYFAFSMDNPPALLKAKFSAGLILLKYGTSISEATTTPSVAVPSTRPDSSIGKGAPVPFDMEGKKLHIYVLMGQSNMVGRDTSTLQEQTLDPHIGYLGIHDKWYVAIEPMHAKGSGIGPGISFARAIQKNDPEGKIGLVPCAVGGSPLSRCAKGGPHS